MRLPPEEERNIDVTALTPELLEATLLYKGEYSVKIIVSCVNGWIEGRFEMDGENLGTFTVPDNGKPLIDVAKLQLWMIEPVIQIKLLFAGKLDDMEIWSN